MGSIQIAVFRLMRWKAPWACLCILLYSIGTWASPGGAENCASALRESSPIQIHDAYQGVDQLGKQSHALLENLNRAVTHGWISTQDWQKFFDDLRPLEQVHIDLENALIINGKLHDTEKARLESGIQSLALLASQLHTQTHSSQNPISGPSKTQTWAELVENPGLLVANKVYEVPLLNGRKLSVRFSEKIVTEVLQTNDPHLALSTQRSLMNIQHGIFGGAYEGAGIKRLILDRSIVELAAYGRDVGRLRFGGYFYENVVHFVTWSNRGEHGSDRYIARFRNGVLAARNQNGHSPR